MTTILRIKRAWRRLTDHGPRIHLQWPVVVRPSRRSCEEAFCRDLRAYLTRPSIADKLTNAELADRLEDLTAGTAFFSNADEILFEASSRLRGPGVPADVHAREDGPVATRRSEP